MSHCVGVEATIKVIIRSTWTLVNTLDATYESDGHLGL